MLLFLIQKIMSCCDISYGDSVPMSTLTPATSTDCEIKIDDLLCNGSESSKFKKNALACLSKIPDDNVTTWYDNSAFDVRSIICKIQRYLRDCWQSNVEFDVLFNIFIGVEYNIDHYIIILTHIIHNTSGFKYLWGWEQKKYAPYWSRGILQIIGEENYKIAGEPYISDPNKLASLDRNAIFASIRVYLHVVPHHARSLYCDSTVYLKPEEVQGLNYTYDYYQERIVGRLNVYLSLCKLLRKKPRFGTQCYFLRRYIQLCN